MKYLLLTEYFPDSENAEITGGIENRCFNFVKELSSHHQITILCSRQPGQKKHSNIFSAEVIRCGPEIYYSNSGSIIKRLHTAFALYKEAKKHSADIIEGSSFLTYLPAYFAGKKNHTKKIATWHETWTGEWIKNKGFITGLFGEIWERIALKLNWDSIISVSNFTKKRLIQRGISENKIKIVPNGINITDITKIKIEKTPYPSLCVIGRLTKQKQVDLIISSLPKIKHKFPNIKLFIIGQGPENESLKKLALTLGLAENIIFYGFVENHEQVLQHLKSSHAYISASKLEGFGITVLEAMASDIPILLSPIEPFKEITQNEAIFFKDKEELAISVIHLLENRHSSQYQIEKQKKIIKNYDWSIIAKKWLN